MTEGDRAGTDVGILLLLDPRWPDGPGVCCWRHSVRTAFTGAGAHVDEASIAVAPQAPVPGRTRSAAPRWLPGRIRRPLGRTYGGLRRRARRLAAAVRPALGRLRRSRPDRDPVSGLGVAALVVAESAEVARAALAAGVEARRLWVLALPEQRWEAGVAAEGAADVEELGARVGGILTDSETARDSVERAVAGRPRVEVFPPLALDRPCPSCVGRTGRLSGDAPHAHVRQLRLWRSIVEDLRTGGPAQTYSFASARIHRPSWTSTPWSDWPGSKLEAPELAGRGPAPYEWSAAAQDGTARLLLATVAPPRPAPFRPAQFRPAPLRTAPPRTAPARATSPAARAVLVSGFDLKFARQLMTRLNARADLAVTLDEWPTLGDRTRRTEALLTAAATVLAEWARPSAVWLSRHKRPGQFLVLRLHRYELDMSYPRQIAIDNVDAVVHVSPHIGRRIHEELGWPAEKLVYIPNYVDVDWLDRPKLPGARFGVGLVGMEFANKRFDLALDVVAEVRRQDARFTLAVRSVMPWNNAYAWDRPSERQYVGWCLERIEHDPWLRGAVVLDAPGRDMARWYRRVGHVLSVSDVEGSHVALAEGMASGAVPVIRPWPGATEIYGKEWISASKDDAVAAIVAGRVEECWADRSARAKAEIRERADPEIVERAWADLLRGDIAGARRHFTDRSGG